MLKINKSINQLVMEVLPFIKSKHLEKFRQHKSKIELQTLE
jgi:hypothetical protein